MKARIVLVVALAFGFIGQASAQSSHHRHGNSDEGQNGSAGQFDYYLLTLSWAPEFCHSHRDSPECAGEPGFVVHGLWPQYTSGGWPQNCSTAPGLADPSTMTDIMADPSLIAHEWAKHGTCSGLNADAYFKLVRQAFTSVHMPQRFSSPSQMLTLTPGEVKDQFVEANSQLTSDDMTVSCGNNYLTAVSICMGKDLQPMTCRNLKDCRANKIKVPPVHP